MFLFGISFPSHLNLNLRLNFKNINIYIHLLNNISSLLNNTECLAMQLIWPHKSAICHVNKIKGCICLFIAFITAKKTGKIAEKVFMQVLGRTGCLQGFSIGFHHWSFLKGIVQIKYLSIEPCFKHTVSTCGYTTEGQEGRMTVLL